MPRSTILRRPAKTSSEPRHISEMMSVLLSKYELQDAESGDEATENTWSTLSSGEEHGELLLAQH